MNNIIEKIINNIPSKDLKKCIITTKHKFDDIELVKMAYDFSTTYYERLNNLNDLLLIIKDAKIINLINDLLNIEGKKLEYIKKQEENSFYDVLVYENPSIYDASHYAFKTFLEANDFIKTYIDTLTKDGEGFYEDENIKYQICKRFFNNYSINDFEYSTDEVGYAEYIKGGILFDVSLNIEIENELCNQNCDGGCYECNNICNNNLLLDLAIKYPPFLKKYDLIKYKNYYKKSTYGIILMEQRNDDSSVYCIPLNMGFFSENEFKECHVIHEHIEVAKAELVNINELTQYQKDLYKNLVIFFKKENY